eukprot:scaffold14529_cov117-Isochrysis_galbana.AAC.5
MRRRTEAGPPGSSPSATTPSSSGSSTHRCTTPRGKRARGSRWPRRRPASETSSSSGASSAPAASSSAISVAAAHGSSILKPVCSATPAPPPPQPTRIPFPATGGIPSSARSNGSTRVAGPPTVSHPSHPAAPPASPLSPRFAPSDPGLGGISLRGRLAVGELAVPLAAAASRPAFRRAAADRPTTSNSTARTAPHSLQHIITAPWSASRKDGMPRPSAVGKPGPPPHMRAHSSRSRLVASSAPISRLTPPATLHAALVPSGRHSHPDDVQTISRQPPKPPRSESRPLSSRQRRALCAWQKLPHAVCKPRPPAEPARRVKHAPASIALAAASDHCPRPAAPAQQYE